MTPGEKSYLLASRAKGLLTADAAELSRRWQQRAVPVRYFGPYYLEAILRPERVEFIRQSCRSAPRAVNRDFRPVGYFYDVAVMGLAEGALPHGLAARMQSLPGALFVAAAVAIFGLPFLISRRGRRLHRSAVVGGVAALGLAGMTMEVALIFALQVIVGHVYAQVGALIAIFMAGLAVGTWSQARASDRGAAAPRRWVAWLLAGSVAFAIIPVVLAALGEIPGDATLLAMVIIGLLMAAGGAVVGAVFPLAVGLLGDLPGAAGWVYAADLAGAALGACMTAVIALPLLGLAPTCYAAALIVAVSAALGAISLRRRRT
jgi:spermidine synthase